MSRRGIQIPVIFLAFSNDIGSGGEGYLRELKNERVAIVKALRNAEVKGLCEVVVEPDATVDDIFRVFNERRYRNRIAVFHYAGHASGKGLHLPTISNDNALAHIKGLAQLFSTQNNLQLVFLNGCSTQAQVEQVKAAGVANVLATQKAIDDATARKFAQTFYQNIGQNDSINNAFTKAEALLLTTQGNNGLFRNLHFEPSDSDVHTDTHPWVLQADSGDWKLGKSGVVYGEHKAIKVFTAYEQADEQYRRKLRNHLTVLRRQKLLLEASMESISAGSDSWDAIEKAMDNAMIIILMISDEFMANDDCYEIITMAMDRHNEKTAIVVPLMISPVLTDGEEFTRLQSLPRNGKPISKWRDADEAFMQVAKEIRAVIQDISNPATDNFWD